MVIDRCLLPRQNLLQFPRHLLRRWGIVVGHHRHRVLQVREYPQVRVDPRRSAAFGRPFQIRSSTGLRGRRYIATAPAQIGSSAVIPLAACLVQPGTGGNLPAARGNPAEAAAATLPGLSPAVERQGASLSITAVPAPL